MTLIAIVDELSAALEPVPEKRDDTAARPVSFEPDVLYAWHRTESLVPDGDGSIDDRRFRIRLAWGVDAQGEVAAAIRNRANSEAIQDKAEALEAVLRGHRTGATYENAQIDQVDYEAFVTSRVRGFYMDISGFVLTS